MIHELPHNVITLYFRPGMCPLSSLFFQMTARSQYSAPKMPLVLLGQDRQTEIFSHRIDNFTQNRTRLHFNNLGEICTPPCCGYGHHREQIPASNVKSLVGFNTPCIVPPLTVVQKCVRPDESGSLDILPAMRWFRRLLCETPTLLRRYSERQQHNWRRNSIQRPTSTADTRIPCQSKPFRFAIGRTKGLSALAVKLTTKD
jgi:hypothetical protein